MTQMNLSVKHKQTHRHGAQACGCEEASAGGKGRELRVTGLWLQEASAGGLWLQEASGGGKDQKFRVSTCEPLYRGWINKALLCSTGTLLNVLG